MRIFKHFLKDEKGATAIEYGLICALIGVALIAAASLVGNEIAETFDLIATELDKAQS